MRALLRRRLNRVQRLGRAILRPHRVHPRLPVGLLLDLPLRVCEKAMRVVQGVRRELGAVGLLRGRNRLASIAHFLHRRRRTGDDAQAGEQQ